MIRGTSYQQDARFADKTKTMIEKSTWPDKYDTKIDLSKVDLELVRVWIEKKVNSLMGVQDDITSGTIISHIEESLEKEERLNAKHLHVAISGLLMDKTLVFMSELWDILQEAQRSSRGIPQSLLTDKKLSQDLYRNRLEQLGEKRMKINGLKLGNVMKRYAERQRSPKRKHKERSRSRSHKRKRSHSHKRKKEKKHKHKHKKDKEHRKEKKRRERRSESSESSGVVSSSNERSGDE